MNKENPDQTDLLLFCVYSPISDIYVKDAYFKPIKTLKQNTQLSVFGNLY